MVFKKGKSGNPSGRKNHPTGYQYYADRAKYLQDQYTVGGIKKLVANEKEFDKLPIRDGQILLQLAETITGEEKRLEREALLDRIEGKPIQREQSLVAVADVNKPLPENYRAALEHYFKIKGIQGDNV